MPKRRLNSNLRSRTCTQLWNSADGLGGESAGAALSLITINAKQSRAHDRDCGSSALISAHICWQFCLMKRLAGEATARRRHADHAAQHHSRGGGGTGSGNLAFAVQIERTFRYRRMSSWDRSSGEISLS
jgi:hypothetical protein